MGIIDHIVLYIRQSSSLIDTLKLVKQLSQIHNLDLLSTYWIYFLIYANFSNPSTEPLTFTLVKSRIILYSNFVSFI